MEKTLFSVVILMGKSRELERKNHIRVMPSL